MRAGDRVNTPRGPGEVGFVRMAPPDFTKIEAVSVLLDSRKLDRGYAGTMFSVQHQTVYSIAGMLPEQSTVPVEVESIVRALAVKSRPMSHGGQGEPPSCQFCGAWESETCKPSCAHRMAVEWAERNPV